MNNNINNNSKTMIHDYDKYKDKGLSGLANLGNTCFINTCLSILSHTYELNNFLEDKKYLQKIKKIHDSALLLEWDNLRQLLWKDNCIISPNKFIQTLQYTAKIKQMDMFTGYDQNDLPEFLLFLIDCFHNSISREIRMTITGNIENDTDKIAVKCFEKIKDMYTKDYSEIWNIFYAVQVTEIISLKSSKQLNIIPEPYFTINLPIPPKIKSPTLLDCFDLFVEGEILSDENAWFNESTNKKENVKKRTLFWSFPTILVIDLKRFNNQNRKNQQLIEFPLTNLNLSKYVIGYKKNSYVYDLYGVCNHSGSVLGGHYTSYVKNANNKWYCFNDSSVSEVPIQNSIVSPKAYCLFYRKIAN